MAEISSINSLPPVGSVLRVPLSNGLVSAAIVVKCSIVGSSAKPHVLVVSSAWIAADANRPTDEELHQLLFLTHHNWKSHLEICWISDPLPTQITVMGSISLTEKELELDSVCYSTWSNLAPQMLLQWRWDNDKEALLLEEYTERQRIAEQGRLYAEKQKEILRTTTLKSLASQEWFQKWDQEGEVLLREKSQALILSLISSLDEMPKPTKAQVRRQLRQSVEAFNKLDMGLGSAIQTTHCEDIMRAFELISIVVKHPSLIDNVEDWRDF